jgi:hypothetical protein
MVTDKSQKLCGKFDFGYIVQQAWNPKTGEVRTKKKKNKRTKVSKLVTANLEQHVINPRCQDNANSHLTKQKKSNPY